MKSNRKNCSRQSSQKAIGRRKKEKAAVKIDLAIKEALDDLGDDPARRVALASLLACVRSRTTLLKPTPGKGNPGWVAPLFLIHRLKNVAMRQRHWIRPCESWNPPCANLRPAFRSLAHHLFAHYTVPGFMDSAWDLTPGPEAFRQQSWYIRLGRGTRMRSLNLTLNLTRHMEHHVRKAPHDHSLTQALRYGETRGRGGSKRLAHEIVGGRLGQNIENPGFWGTVLDFFAAHPEMNMVHVNPIIDFIHDSRFAQEEVATHTGRQIRTPPRPDFSMKGRTLKSVLRLVARWNVDCTMNRAGKCIAWPKSIIGGYRFSEKRPDEIQHRDWTIQELLDSNALRAEGRALRHCVHTYAIRCQRAETTIWSLRLRLGDREKRMATIEVNPQRRAITQVRAKCNLPPGGQSIEIIRQWADQAGLKLEHQM